MAREENPYEDPENCLEYIRGYAESALAGPRSGDKHFWEHIENLKAVIEQFLEVKNQVKSR